MCIGNGNMIMWPPNKTYQELYSTLNPNKDVFEEFVASYSKKMWGSEFKNIYANIKDRFKFKDNYNSDFFENEDVNLLYFNNLFDNITKNLRIKLNKPQTLENIYYEMDSWDKVFVTTPIDEFFSYKLGKLDWRGITFNFKNIVSDNNILPTPVVNLNSHPEFTRITEYNQLNVNGFNSFDKIKCLCYEQPNSTDKYYPVLNKKNQALLEKYKVEAKKHSDYVHFCGRLGTFRYLDMDQTIIEAINIFKEYRKNDK
jgi:UDP-galactopyranose mutase